MQAESPRSCSTATRRSNVAAAHPSEIARPSIGLYNAEWRYPSIEIWITLRNDAILATLVLRIGNKSQASGLSEGLLVNSLIARVRFRASVRKPMQSQAMKLCHPLLILVVLAASSPGCGFTSGSNDSRDAVTPDHDTARRALELALKGWVEGRTGPLALEQSSVQFTDHDHRVGNRLASYEVLGTRTSDRFPIFTVRLHWQDSDESSEPDTVEYFVGGTQPIWVIRHDELQMILHWEHPMTLENAGNPQPTDQAVSKPAPVDPQPAIDHEP
jgi:hypothetical protein